MKTKGKPLSIYIHIPFCVRKCNYCDFLSAPADEKSKEQYVECLLTEIEAEASSYRDYEVQTVFIGGGTPSVLPADVMVRLMETLKTCFFMAKDAEITIEVNPGTVDGEKLSAYYKSGINRLSIGLQSTQEYELQLLGRIHSYEDFLKTYQDAVKSGFNNINIDLMSAIPGQTIESYKETLGRVLALKPMPAHISAYSLIIEEGTPFYEEMPEVPDEETDRIMYKITDDMLKKMGYHRYEISNYAREGYICRHNRVYWRRGNYVGFGIGAASLVENIRFHNVSDIQFYIKEIVAYRDDKRRKLSLKEDIQSLTIEEQMEEYLFLGLRLTEGISTKEFENTFGRTVDEVYPGVIDKWVKEGLLVRRQELPIGDERIALTDFGLDVSNIVMADFLISDN